MQQSNLDRGLALLSNTADFPNIPQALVKYASRCIKKGNTNRLTKNRLIKAFARDPKSTIQAMDRMFKEACEATCLTPDELLKATDFNYRDNDPTRLDAAFAEIRSINFLRQEGFSRIKPLKASKKKGSDIVAERCGLNYAVEVADSIYDVRKRFSPEQIKDWLVGRLISSGKAEQLTATAGQLKNAHRIFIGVVDTAATVALQTREEFLEAAKMAWRESGEDPSLHLCIVTGRVSVGYGRDDSIFPPWQENNAYAV